MSVNKVTAFGENLIDLTEDTVTKDTLIKGVTAHDASGNSVTGTFDTDKYLEKAGDASNTTAVFSASKERANISTGEKLSVIFGKIAKFFSDLKTVAFTGNYSDLSGTPSVVSKTADGLCPKNGGTTTKFLRDDGTYAVPTSSVSGLSTLEQVTAAATAGNVTAPVGAGALAEVNSSLTDQPTFEYDESGKITGYKTKIGGADTVFPFNNRIKLTGAKYNIYITSSDNARNVTVDVLKDGYVQLCCVPITGGSSLIYSDYYACLYVNQVIQENILTDSNMCCSDIAEVKSGDVLKLFLPAFFTSKGQTKGYLIYTEGVI